jgi:hypothetical protein
VSSEILDDVEVLANYGCCAMIQKIAGIVKEVVGYDHIFAVLKFLTIIEIIRWINNILNGAERLVSSVLNTDPQILKVMDRKTHK